MKKNSYEKPQMDVIEIEKVSIITASGTVEGGLNVEEGGSGDTINSDQFNWW